MIKISKMIQNPYQKNDIQPGEKSTKQASYLFHSGKISIIKLKKPNLNRIFVTSLKLWGVYWNDNRWG